MPVADGELDSGRKPSSLSAMTQRYFAERLAGLVSVRWTN